MGWPCAAPFADDLHRCALTAGARTAGHMPHRTSEPTTKTQRAARIRQALARVDPTRLLPGRRARPRKLTTPSVRSSRSSLARPVHERPAAQRLARWNWEDRQRDIVLAGA